MKHLTSYWDYFHSFTTQPCLFQEIFHPDLHLVEAANQHYTVVKVVLLLLRDPCKVGRYGLIWAMLVGNQDGKCAFLCSAKVPPISLYQIILNILRNSRSFCLNRYLGHNSWLLIWYALSALLNGLVSKPFSYLTLYGQLLWFIAYPNLSTLSYNCECWSHNRDCSRWVRYSECTRE
jgi:hypothetical protein